MPRGLFVTGTGTGVGKTYVGALVAGALRDAGKRVGVYKPVASGCERNGNKLISADAVALWEGAGRPGSLSRVCPQVFAAPLAPHLAARAEGKCVDPKLLRDGIQFWLDSSEIVIVEGAGGLMSPISDDDYNADLAADFGFPLLVVAENVLGTINATLQTLITAQEKGVRTLFSKNGSSSQTADQKRVLTPLSVPLSVAGVVLNSPRSVEHDPSARSNANELRQRCTAPLLATIEFGGGFDRAVDWWSLAKMAFKPKLD
jgi:dethiobiotin synthetase